MTKTLENGYLKLAILSRKSNAENNEYGISYKNFNNYNFRDRTRINFKCENIYNNIFYIIREINF